MPRRPSDRPGAADAFVKREFVACASGEADAAAEDEQPGDGEELQGRTERRALRSRYLEVKNLISDERDNISKVDSDKFASIISEVESLHKYVRRPREQIADAEALLEIATTLVTSVKAHRNEGMTPSDFVTALLKNFGQQDVASTSQNACLSISWSNVGLDVSHIFQTTPGCCTMLGPMNIEPKQRKIVSRKRRTPAGQTACPEEVEENEADKRTDTDKNMSTMFEVLRKHRNVRLEELVLNRVSFAQTVENIFALSFLVKDGRVQMKVNSQGQHMLSPRNAPSAADVSSGQVSFSHFVFRFDYKDWQLMLNIVDPGDELMPHRVATSAPSSSQVDQSQGETIHEPSHPASATPIRKFTRNRGLVTQEESVAEDLQAPDTAEFQEIGRKKKRTLFRK